MNLILKYIILLGFSLLSWNCLALPLAESLTEEESRGKIERLEETDGQTVYEAFQNLTARTPSAITAVRGNGTPLTFEFFKRSHENLLMSVHKSRTTSSFFKTNKKKLRVLSSERRKKGYYIYALRKILL